VGALLGLVRGLLGSVVLLHRQDPVDRAGHGCQAHLRGRPWRQGWAVVEAAGRLGAVHGTDDLILLHQDPDRLGLVDPGLVAVAAGILAQGALQVLADADVVHH